MLARAGLPGFTYVRAVTRDEVVRLLGQHGPDARLLMGGTDLLVRMRDGVIAPKVVVDVKAVPGMRDIAYDPESGLSIGAAVTLNQVARHRHVRKYYPLLAEAAGSVAYYQVRNRATLGGNLSNASPAADTAPAVLVLEGRIVLYGPGGEREVAAEEFFLGPGRSACRPEEFVTGIRVPIPPASGKGKYLKLGRNKAGDLAVVGAAVFGYPDQCAPSGYSFRLALASVAPTPLRVHEAEQVFSESKPGKGVFALAARKAMEVATPIDDIRASASYRKEMVRNLVLRGLEQVWGELESRSER